MKNVYFDNARNLKFNARINSAVTKDFVFFYKPTDPEEDPSLPYDINNYTFEFFIKKFPGDRKKIISLTTSGGGLSFPSYTENTLRLSLTQAQSRIEEGEYYCELVRTDVNKTWLNGLCYFSFGPTDSSDDVSTVTTIDESGTALIVTITNEVTDDDIISALGYTPLGELITANRQTASYTLVLTDKNKLVEMNVASANNLTVPPNSSVAFDIGTQILISQYGAGQTTVVAGSGVTIRSDTGKLKISVQYAGACLVKIATNEWYLFGSLTT